jgi:hypothetical protein
MTKPNADLHSEQNGDFALRVSLNQQKLTSDLRSAGVSIVHTDNGK